MKSDSEVSQQENSPNFSCDWFSQHIPNWTRHLEKFVGKDVSFLEIGSYEGRSSLWLMENILTNPKSKLTCIDLWEDYPESERLGFKVTGKIEVFKNNLSKYIDRITMKQGSSFEIVPTLVDQYDFIYVDGDHTVTGCWTDAINSFAKLKVGGVMIFDDYDWWINRGTELHPKEAVDRFIKEYADKITVKEVAYQVVIEKCQQ